MLDQITYPLIQPHLASTAAKFEQGGLDSTKVLAGSFVLGLTGAFCAGMALYIPALIFLLLGRAGAGIAMAGSLEISPGKRYLSILADFIVFAAFVFFFTLGAEKTSMAAAFAIFSILVMGIAYMGAPAKGGITGQGEMILFMTICCLFPQAFSLACLFFGLLCWVTAGIRAFKTARL